MQKLLALIYFVVVVPYRHIYLRIHIHTYIFLLFLLEDDDDDDDVCKGNKTRACVCESFDSDLLNGGREIWLYIYKIYI